MFSIIVIISKDAEGEKPCLNTFARFYLFESSTTKLSRRVKPLKIYYYYSYYYYLEWPSVKNIARAKSIL